jgi:hypothetical protein
LHLKPVGKLTFRIQVLADTGATRSLISLSTATTHGCEIKETNVCFSAANGTKINVTGMTSLQVVEKGRLVHTIVAIVSQNVTQTIVGWKDLMAMGVISSDWPAMPQQEDNIHAADNDEEEKQLATPRRSARVQERKARETAAGTVNAIFTQQQPPPKNSKKRRSRRRQRRRKERRRSLAHHCQAEEKNKKKGRGSSHQPAAQVRCKQQQLPWDCHRCSRASSSSSRRSTTPF